MNKTLHELISNPNAASSEEVRNMLQNETITATELTSVLGRSVVNELTKQGQQQVTLEDIEGNILLKDYDEFTQVYIWGQSKSGKTSVLGALATAIKTEYILVSCTNKGKSKQRLEKLTQYFSSTQRHYRPLVDENVRASQVYQIECHRREGLTKKTYPLTLIEANIDHTTLVWNDINIFLKKPNNKIHIFCFDCSLPPLQQKEQARKFLELMDKLREKKVLETSVGIYVLVTKTDLMLRVPVEHRVNTAQTLITAGQQQLWQTIVNACYQMDIYDSTPIPFSIGDSILRDLIRPDLSNAIDLLERPILLKSQPRLNWLQRLLRKGNSTTTAVIVAFVVGMAGYGAYKVLDSLPTAPTESAKVYNFTADFLAREKKLIAKETDYLRAEKAYQDLNWELLVEQNILNSYGDSLKDVSLECRNRLDNDFASKVINRYKYIYSTSTWAENTAAKEVTNQARQLINRGYVAAAQTDSIDRYVGYLNELPKAKAVIARSKQCYTWDDVQYVQNNHRKYLKYPYDNDRYLKPELANCIRNAYESYASHLIYRANRARNDYNSEIRWIEDNVGWLYRHSRINQARNEYRANTLQLKSQIDYALSESSCPETVRETLRQARQLINF